MTKNDAIEILVVANGFMVRQTPRNGEFSSMNSMHVFSSLRGLSKFLFNHFDDHHTKPNDGGKRK